MPDKIKPEETPAEKLDARTQYEKNPSQFFEDEFKRIARKVGEELVPGNNFTHELVIASARFYEGVQAGAMLRAKIPEGRTRQLSINRVNKALGRIKRVQHECLKNLTPDEKLLVLGSLFGDDETAETLGLAVTSDNGLK